MIVYFDMDNVLAAFQKGAYDLCGIITKPQGEQTDEEDDIMWAAIRNVPHFYDKLEMMPGAKELWDYAFSHLGPEGCQILSAAPKPKRGILTAAEDKTAWCRRMLHPDAVVHIVYSKHEKRDRCNGPDCVLVDDLKANIDEWTANGGTGVLFTDAAEALKALQEIFRQAGIA